MRGAAEGVSLSVAMPAYNEATNLPTVLDEWRDELARERRITAWQLVVADDGSTDGSGEVLAATARRMPQLVVVSSTTNRGAAAALESAIGATTLDWVLLTDADGQYPAANLSALLDAALWPGVRAVSGARVQKSDTAPYRFGSWASGWVSNLAHGTRYRDFNSIFKLVEGDLLRSLTLESAGMNCSTEITSVVHELGVDWVEVPVRHVDRRSGGRGGTYLKGARDRLLFVAYLAARRSLVRRGVIRRSGSAPDRSTS